MKLVALVGSLRKESYNMQLAKTIQERFQNKFELYIPDLRSLPYFNQDDEYDPPEVVRQFKQAIKEADGVIMIMPEYSWSVPGVLKNAIDWLSRVDKVMLGKPVMTAGVSIGMMGTIRAQLHLRQILASPGIQAKLLPPAGNEIVINFAEGKFEAGRLVDQPTLQFVDEVVNRFIGFVQQ